MKKFILSLFSWWIISKKETKCDVLRDLNTIINLYLYLYLNPESGNLGINHHYNKNLKIKVCSEILVDLKEYLFFNPLEKKQVIIRLREAQKVDSDALRYLIGVVEEILEHNALSMDEISKWLETDLLDLWETTLPEGKAVVSCNNYIDHINMKLKLLVQELKNNHININVKNFKDLRDSIGNKNLEEEVNYIYKELYLLLTNEKSIIMDANIDLIGTLHFTKDFDRKLFKNITVRNTSNDKGIFKQLEYRPFKISA